MLKDILFILLFFLFSTNSYTKELTITSDNLEIIRTENTSIFSGNVYVIEENLEIWSEELIVYSTKDEKQIREITAQYDVKILRQELSIEGERAKYDPINNLLQVFGGVRVLQNENIILCDEIILDLENSSSIMKSKALNRVEALIITEDIN